VGPEFRGLPIVVSAELTNIFLNRSDKSWLNQEYGSTKNIDFICMPKLLELEVIV